MPLTVKAFRGKATPTYVQMNPADSSLSDEDSMQDSELHINVRTSPAYLYVCFGILSLTFDIIFFMKPSDKNSYNNCSSSRWHGKLTYFVEILVGG